MFFFLSNQKTVGSHRNERNEQRYNPREIIRRICLHSKFLKHVRNFIFRTMATSKKWGVIFVIHGKCKALLATNPWNSVNTFSTTTYSYSFTSLYKFIKFTTHTGHPWICIFYFFFFLSFKRDALLKIEKRERFRNFNKVKKFCAKMAPSSAILSLKIARQKVAFEHYIRR